MGKPVYRERTPRAASSRCRGLVTLNTWKKGPVAERRELAILRDSRFGINGRQTRDALRACGHEVVFSYARTKENLKATRKCGGRWKFLAFPLVATTPQGDASTEDRVHGLL